jgi:hypothetical protein
MHKLLLAAAALSTLALTACGGPGAKLGGGQQGAAEALAAATRSTTPLAALTGSGLDVVSLSFNCLHGGHVSFAPKSLSVAVGSGGVSAGDTFTLNFHGCGAAKSDVGVAEYEGTLDVTQAVIANSAGARLRQHLRGHLMVKGAFDDTLDVDVTQELAVSEVGLFDTDVTMSLSGTVATQEASFQFDAPVTVSVGHLTVAVSTTK